MFHHANKSGCLHFLSVAYAIRSAVHGSPSERASERASEQATTLPRLWLWLFRSCTRIATWCHERHKTMCAFVMSWARRQLAQIVLAKLFTITVHRVTFFFLQEPREWVLYDKFRPTIWRKQADIKRHGTSFMTSVTLCCVNGAVNDAVIKMSQQAVLN